MMPPEPELVSATRIVLAELERLDVSYAIGGSVASSLYGEPRTTRDVDIVAALKSAQIAPLALALRGSFYADVSSMREAVEQQRSFNMIHLETMVKVDVFVATGDVFRRAQIQRRIEKDFGIAGEGAFFVSPEDVVLSKLRWYRDGGCVSDRQWRDIQGVLKVQGDRLDFSYLREWAKEFDLSDLLARALDDAGVGPAPGAG